MKKEEEKKNCSETFQRNLITNQVIEGYEGNFFKRRKPSPYDIVSIKIFKHV